MYRPLPSTLTIKSSNIDGLGLFSVSEIPNNTILGVTHIKDDRFDNGYSRTPLGGFFNHLTENHIKLLKHLKWSVNDKGFIVGTENEVEDPAPFGENTLYEAIDLILNGMPEDFDPFNM